MTSILHKLRALFLSPDSNLELRLRTLYHRFSATRLAFSFQDWQSRRSYRKWLAQQGALIPPSLEASLLQPKVCFLLVYTAEEIEKTLLTLDSLQNLTIQNWEVLLLPTTEEKAAPLPPEVQQDVRIKSIDAFSLDQTTGYFLVFCAPGDHFSKHLLAHFYAVLNTSPDSDVYYFDCEYQPGGRAKNLPFMKPELFSPELLLSVNYLSRGFIRKTAIIPHEGLIDFRNNLLATEYELILHLAETDGTFTHIPQVLVFQERLSTAENTSSTKAILSHLNRMGRQKTGSEKIGKCVRFSWDVDNPSIAIIIPTKNHPALLENLLTSILEKTEYQNFTIHLVDNGSTDEATLTYYEIIKRQPRCAIIPFPESFNYSNAINLGVKRTESELVLLLNDDMEVIDPHWLSELAQWAMRPEIGVVGARLLRANRTIQHAGIIIGLNGFAGHIYLNAPQHYSGLSGSVDWVRNYLAVTGACQMVRRELFNSIGGYDSNYRLAFGDVDFCLRIHEAGYRNIYTPFANLFHYEGKARGFQTPIADIQRGYQEMAECLSKPDPYFSPNLTYTRIPHCDLKITKEDNRMQQIEERKKFYLLTK